MPGVRSLWIEIQASPVVMRRAHGWLTLAWLAAASPICLLLANSVPALVFISVYANVAGHWSSWQSSRVEVKQEDDGASFVAAAGTPTQTVTLYWRFT